MATPIQIYVAEVLEVIYSDSNPNLIYGLKVKLKDLIAADDVDSVHVITAKPLNMNLVRIPIVGEFVLVARTISSYSSGYQQAHDTYYLDIVNLQSSIHHNALPGGSKISVVSDTLGNSDKYNSAAAGNSATTANTEIDPDFSENPNVKPLQNYTGDVLLKGRYGQSIRFSTTPKSGNFTKQPNWYEGDESAPITVIRNTRQTTNTGQINDFVTEDFIKDDNIIVLSSGHKLNFQPASRIQAAINSKKVTSWKDEKWGVTPQTLLSSGRIIFNSSQQEIVAFAKTHIGLSAEKNITIESGDTISLNSAKIELTDGATEPLILGTQWKTWMENFLTLLSTVTVPTPMGMSGPVSSSPTWPQIEALKAQLQLLLSDVAYTAKTNKPSVPSNTIAPINADIQATVTGGQRNGSNSNRSAAATQTYETDTTQNLTQEESSTPQEQATDTKPINSPNREFWTLVAVCSREDNDPQSWADIAQVIYNRLGSKAYGASTIAGLITTQWQFEPTWRYPKPGQAGIPNPEWRNIQTIEDAAKATKHSVAYLTQVANAIKNKNLQENAKKFIQGRTDFKGIGQPAKNSRGKIQRPNGNQFGWEYNYTSNITYLPPKSIDDTII